MRGRRVAPTAPTPLDENPTQITELRTPGGFLRMATSDVGEYAAASDLAGEPALLVGEGMHQRCRVAIRVKLIDPVGGRCPSG